MTNSVESITINQWINFILPMTLKVAKDYDYTLDWLSAVTRHGASGIGDSIGSFIYNGGGDHIHDDLLNMLYAIKYKAFLVKNKINELDMYIYLVKYIEEELGFFSCNRSKENVLAIKCMEVIDEYQHTLNEVNDNNKEGIIAFQALWRGHNTRWEYPIIFYSKDSDY